MTMINSSNSSNENQPRITPSQLDAWRRMSRDELEALKLTNRDEDVDTVLNQLCWIKIHEFEISKCWGKINAAMAERTQAETLTTPPEPATTVDPTIVNKRYVYGMRNRPAGYATCPDGRLTDLDNPTDARATFGTVVYERELTVHDLYRYEMFPVDPLPALPLYPEGAHVRDIRNHKEFTVEFFDGDWWVGSALLRTVQDWLFYELCLSAPPEPPAAPDPKPQVAPKLSKAQQRALQQISADWTMPKQIHHKILEALQSKGLIDTRWETRFEGIVLVLTESGKAALKGAK